METMNQSKQKINHDELLNQLTIINNCLKDSKCLITRLKHNERICIQPVNIKKEPPSQT